MNFLDVRDELPKPDPYWEIGRFGRKSSRTYHWNGPAIPVDVHPLELILGDAYYHMTLEWGLRMGVTSPTGGADGIMYHRLIAPNGDLYITRDFDAVLWACGSPIGNVQSEHVQVMCGVGQRPTTAQFVTMAWLEINEPLGDTWPHSFWSSTTCPGDDIRAWIEARTWAGEDDLTPEQDRMLREVHEALFPGQDGVSVFTKIEADADTTKVHLGRVQRNVDVERGGPDGSFDPAKPAIDSRINNP